MEFKAEHIGKTYDSHRILTDVTFTVGAGECLAVTGASGIGKTTLLRIITGLEKPDSGEIIFEGISRENVRFAPVRGLADTLYQVTLTVKENLFPLKNFRNFTI